MNCMSAFVKDCSTPTPVRSLSGREGVWRVGVGQSSREETAKGYCWRLVTPKSYGDLSTWGVVRRIDAVERGGASRGGRCGCDADADKVLPLIEAMESQLWPAANEFWR